MSQKRATDILKKYGQRITDGRVALLKLMMKNPQAFAFTEIEKQLPISIDRVTIYRTLHTFESIGLLQKVIDSKGVGRYMFNHIDHHDIGIHPHLRCNECGKVVCLPCLPKEYLASLEKYEIGEMYFLMEGTCLDCSTTENKECSV